jgi:integrase
MRYYLKQRKNGIWNICWTEPNGTPRRASTRTRDREEADLALARWVIRHGQAADQSPVDVTVEAILVRYWYDHGQTRFSPGIIKRVIALVATHLPHAAVAELTVKRQHEFMAAMNVAPNTQRRYMGVVAAALERARKAHELASYPSIQVPECEDGEGTRPLSLDELRAIFSAARNEHAQRFLILALATGARPQAVLQLTWDRIKDGVANFRVPGRRRVKKRRAIAPLSPLVACYLEDRRSIGPVIQYRGRALKGHKMTFQRIAERAKVPATAYCLKKSIATWLRQKNVPEWEVGALLAHRVGNAQTEKYAHHRPDYMLATKAAVDALLIEIAPPWLANYLPAPEITNSDQAVILKTVNGLDGRREWDRTTDHLHVKDTVLALIQPLSAANDD